MLGTQIGLDSSPDATGSSRAAATQHAQRPRKRLMPARMHAGMASEQANVSMRATQWLAHGGGYLTIALTCGDATVAFTAQT